MAKKIILRAILPILVFAMALFSVFWFVKSGEIKKNIKEVLELSASSQVGNISSTGFPLSHKIEIEDIRLVVDKQVDDVIVISKIVTESAIFSNEFTANIIGDIVIESIDKSNSTIKFNKEPFIKFSVEDYKINKITYNDDGYKLLDKSGNTIFYAGSSNLDFVISSDANDVTKTRLNANFRNISSFDIFTVGDIIEVADEPKDEKDIDAKELASVDIADKKELSDKGEVKADAQVKEAEVKSIIKAVESNDKIKTNRDLTVDLFVLSQINKETQELEIKDVTINNIELFSPLFKVNINGAVNSLSQSDQKIDFVLKIKNIDNILIYIRKFISSLIPLDLEIVDAQSTSQENQEEEKKGQESVEEEQVIQPIPEEVIAGLIVELAQRNENSNDQFSEFKIVGNESGFAINNMTMAEILEKLEPVLEFLVSAFFGNIGGEVEPMPKEQVEEKDLAIQEEKQEEITPIDSKDNNAPEVTKEPEAMQKPEVKVEEVKMPQVKVEEAKNPEVKDEKPLEVPTPIAPEATLPELPTLPTPEIKPDIDEVTDVVPQVPATQEESSTTPASVDEIDPTKVDPASLNSDSTETSN